MYFTHLTSFPLEVLKVLEILLQTFTLTQPIQWSLQIGLVNPKTTHVSFATSAFSFPYFVFHKEIVSGGSACIE